MPHPHKNNLSTFSVPIKSIELNSVRLPRLHAAMPFLSGLAFEVNIRPFNQSSVRLVT